MWNWNRHQQFVSNLWPSWISWSQHRTMIHGLSCVSHVYVSGLRNYGKCRRRIYNDLPHEHYVVILKGWWLLQRGNRSGLKYVEMYIFTKYLWVSSRNKWFTFSWCTYCKHLGKGRRSQMCQKVIGQNVTWFNHLLRMTASSRLSIHDLAISFHFFVAECRIEFIYLICLFFFSFKMGRTRAALVQW